MSIVSHPSSVSTVEPCWRCGEPTPSDFNADPHLCDACHRMQADKATHEALCIISALRKGEPPFDILSDAERVEHLATLIDTAHPAARGAVANFPNEQLIDVIASGRDPEMVGAAAAELADRLDAIPNPDERRQIESDDEQYHRELTMAREAEAAEQPIDHNDW